MTLTPVTYNLSATYGSNNHASLCGYSTGLGFGNTSGTTNAWLCDILNQHHDNSYLFVGGLSTFGQGGSPFPLSMFDLRFDTDNVYTPANNGFPAVSEMVQTSVAIPSQPHAWKLRFRWRVVGGTPEGCQDDDIAIGFEFYGLGSALSDVRLLTRTYAQSSPHFRTDTVELRNTMVLDNGPFTTLGTTLATDTGDAIMNSPQYPPAGPNYLPAQLSWMDISGPYPITTPTSARPAGGRGHFI